MEKKSWNLQIPSVILLDKNINSTQKILLSLILSLSNETGYCYASNNYLGGVLDMNKVALSNLLSVLENKNYIEREIIRNEKKQIIKRSIKIKIDIPINKNINRSINKDVKHPINENIKENNILINKIRISI
jgi:SOS-response transcriptional repressor LexA